MQTRLRVLAVAACWVGGLIIAPAGSPRPMIDRINNAMSKAIEDPNVVDRLLKQGIEPLTMKPNEIDALLRSDLEKTARIIKAAGDSIKQ